MAYVTFKVKSGEFVTGILQEEKFKTVVVRPVEFGIRSMVSGITPIIRIFPAISLHKVKKSVTIWPEGILPINR